ncbi:MAG TPA: ABC transporter substrate-binding protein [Candidatus Acidoferrales bacterium]|nr:ABC transporter substrate-binding protein [Candidatus Acidoferrales bacterium]
MQRASVFALGLSFVLGALADLLAASSAPKRGGTVTLAVSRDMTVMNPLVDTSSTQARIRELMFEPLLGIDLQGNLRPNLAESWEVSPDRRLYTFRLRRGVKFHNDREMTADDVKFAIDYTMNPKNGARGYQELAVVENVTAADKYTLRMHLKRPIPAFLYLLTDIAAFSVIPKGSLEEGVRNPGKFAPGTGPFKFTEWLPQQRIVMTRFDGYWGQKALVEQVVLRVINDITVRFTALRAGDVDMIERAPYEWVKEIAQGKLKGLSFVPAPYAGGRAIEFNVVDPPFDNKKLRLAVAHAIDRKEILDAAYFGFGEVSDQRYPKGHRWYIDGVPAPAYDVSRARNLLREAGYKGEPIEIMGNLGEQAEVEAAVIQSQLRRIGMNVQIRMMDRGAAFEARRKGRYAFKLAGGGSVGPDPVDSYLPIHVCEPDPRRRNQNETGYCDRQMDAWLKEAQAEHDEENLRQLLKKIIAKINDDVPEILIGFTPRFFAMRDFVKGFTTNHEGDFRWWGGGMNYVWLDK